MSGDVDNLREAIRVARFRAHNTYSHWSVESDVLTLLADVAESTLPKTKMIKVWRVEGAQKMPNGSWKPWLNTFESEGDAARDADFMRREPGYSCVKLTGPHQQEVPA